MADPAEAVIEIRYEAKRTAEAFLAMAAEAPVAWEAVAERSYAHGIGKVFAGYGRVRDLRCSASPGRCRASSGCWAHTALFDSGRPLLLGPEQAAVFVQERIMVAWDATPTAVCAITGAVPLLKAARQVVVASVLEDKAFRRGKSGVEMRRHLARHCVSATFFGCGLSATGPFWPH